MRDDASSRGRTVIQQREKTCGVRSGGGPTALPRGVAVDAPSPSSSKLWLHVLSVVHPGKLTRAWMPRVSPGGWSLGASGWHAP